MYCFKRITFLLITVIILTLPSFSFASSTNGTIDTVNRYAWGENIGWVDFGDSTEPVTITDDVLSGSAWTENVGWIILNCVTTDSCDDVNYKVINDGEGNLSGYGWGENIGWLDFDSAGGQVAIDTDGIFSGAAWSENAGWIIFNCSVTDSCDDVNYYVETDWRPQSSRPDCNNGIDDDTDGAIDYPDDDGCDSLDDTNEVSETTPSEEPTGTGGGSGSYSFQPPFIVINEGATTTDTPLVNLDLFGGFDASSMRLSADPDMNEAFEVFQTQREWNLCSGFITCSPGIYNVYVQFFDELGNVSAILNDRITLTQASINQQELSSRVESRTITASVLSVNNIRSFFRVRSNPNFIDNETEISLDNKNIDTENITSIPNAPLEIAFTSPRTEITLVTTYVLPVETHRTPRFRPLAYFGQPAYAQNNNDSLEDNALLMQKIELSKYDLGEGNSLFQGKMKAPQDPGNYEIITRVQYQKDGQDITTTINFMSTVVPYGYVYHQKRRGELRIKNAIVSLFYLNPETKTFELWEALDADQLNPQVTNKTGGYSFFVPEGSYYIEVHAPYYRSHTTPVFFSRGDGREINIPIELDYSFWWVRLVQAYKIIGVAILVIIVFLCLPYRRKHLFK